MRLVSAQFFQGGPHLIGVISLQAAFELGQDLEKIIAAQVAAHGFTAYFIDHQATLRSYGDFNVVGIPLIFNRPINRNTKAVPGHPGAPHGHFHPVP